MATSNLDAFTPLLLHHKTSSQTSHPTNQSICKYHSDHLAYPRTTTSLLDSPSPILSTTTTLKHTLTTNLPNHPPRIALFSKLSPPSRPRRPSRTSRKSSYIPKTKKLRISSPILTENSSVTRKRRRSQSQRAVNSSLRPFPKLQRVLRSIPRRKTWLRHSRFHQKHAQVWKRVQWSPRSSRRPKPRISPKPKPNSIHGAVMPRK